MADWELHDKTDTPIETTIPRNLTGATVELLWGEDEVPYDTVSFIDREKGRVKAGIKEIDPDSGYHKIHWKITYDDGTVEVLPPFGDTVRIA